MESTQTLSTEYHQYAESAYPSNHTYQIKNGLLVPKKELSSRLRIIRQLYPHPLTSMLDISCSKGFFVFDAAALNTCERALGIDIHDYDITFTRALKRHLNSQNTRFERMTLGQLAASIDDFGGAFQTLLVINCYQYLYFGSDVSTESHESHDEIFANFRRVCNGRIIFNNRIEVADCQNTKHVIAAPEKARFYSRKELYAAASKYFTVTEHGKIGKYPLITMDAK